MIVYPIHSYHYLDSLLTPNVDTACSCSTAKELTGALIWSTRFLFVYYLSSKAATSFNSYNKF